MDNLFSIGQTAKLLNTTVATLRHYDNIGLVKPFFINEENNYRYYSYDQFHIIDRIKYLQSMGLTLIQIKDIIHNNDINKLISFLVKQKNSYLDEIDLIKEKIKDIDWYINYFLYMDSIKTQYGIFFKRFEERYVLKVPFFKDELSTQTELRLTELKNSDNYRDLNYLRQWTYILDYDSISNFEFQPKYTAMYLKNKPDIIDENILVLPKGEYLCFQSKLLAKDFGDLSIAKDFIKKHNYQASLVVANEYEDNFSDYLNAPYEVQILLK